MEMLNNIKKTNFNLNFDDEFLEVLRSSFEIYLRTSARSNEKLKVLHGFISKTLQNLIGYSYHIDSLGIGDGKEVETPGRYMNKKVDITISNKRKVIAGIAVKFVMSNYSQNSNNYFECMLGETANIRSNNIPYFQVFIIPDKIPYYDKNGNITRWEEISRHNLGKYINLSNDDVNVYLHAPNKTLVGIVHMDDCPRSVVNYQLYKEYYLTNRPHFTWSNKDIEFGSSVVFNSFDDFVKKIAYFIMSI